MKMIHLKTLLTVLTLTLSGQSSFLHATTTPPPEAFLHPNMGCLENTECSAEYGTKRQAFLKELKSLTMKGPTPSNFSTLIKNVGLPISFYFKGEQTHHPKMMSYTSSCAKLKNKGFFEAEVFVKNLSDDLLSSHLNSKLTPYPQPIVLYKGKNRLTFNVPLRETPVAFDDHKLIFVLEIEENFYYLKISSDGSFSLHSYLANTTQYVKSEVTCPDDKEIMSSLPFEKNYCIEMTSPKNEKIMLRLFNDCL